MKFTNIQTSVPLYHYNRPPEKERYTNTLYKKIVKELDLSIRPQRAGVIIYTKWNNEYYYGLGIDTASKEITDFGGGISYKRDENVICGALREFKEETLGIFGDVRYEDVLEAPVIYNNTNLIIFKYVHEDPFLIRERFLQHFIEAENTKDIPEVCDIIWMTTTELKHCIMTRGKMFFRVQTFLQKAGNFYWLL